MRIAIAIAIAGTVAGCTVADPLGGETEDTNEPSEAADPSVCSTVAGCILEACEGELELEACAVEACAPGFSADPDEWPTRSDLDAVAYMTAAGLRYATSDAAWQDPSSIDPHCEDEACLYDLHHELYEPGEVPPGELECPH